MKKRKNNNKNKKNVKNKHNKKNENFFSIWRYYYAITKKNLFFYLTSGRHYWCIFSNQKYEFFVYLIAIVIFERKKHLINVLCHVYFDKKPRTFSKNDNATNTRNNKIFQCWKKWYCWFQIVFCEITKCYCLITKIWNIS